MTTAHWLNTVAEHTESFTLLTSHIVMTRETDEKRRRGTAGWAGRERELIT